MCNDHQIVFVGGLHRSGTTVLANCLRDHPEVSGFDDTGVPENEGQHLQTVYKPALAHGGAGKFGFDPAARLFEDSPLVSEENKSRLIEEWGGHWDMNCSVLLEKSPPNLIRCRFLQALFPGAKFIMILRHPTAVSYATQKWSHTSIPSLMEHWLLCHEAFLEDRPKIRNLHVLQYENFVSDPTRHLGEIYEFLGLESIPATIEVRTDINAKYFGMHRADLEKTLRAMPLRRAVKRFESRARRFGYSFEDLNYLGAPETV